MRLTRRQVLAASPALLAACAGGDSVPKGDDTGLAPTPERDPEPADWNPGGTVDEAIFAWGLQAGDPTPTSIVLSVRSTETALTVRLARADGDAWTELDPIPLTRTDETVQTTLTGLTPDTAYRWFVQTADGARTRLGRFRTAPEAIDRVVRIGATSCLRDNQPWPNLSFAAAEDFDCFFFLGDTVYAEGPALEDYRASWRAQLAEEGLKAITARAAMFATWDDHEVGNNWSMDNLAEGQFEAALAAYRESMPQGVGPSGGIYRSFSWGGVVDIFVLDCRGERDGTHYISVAQMDWLKAGLAASTARFKLLLNSVPITDFTDMFGAIEADDRWQGFPDQRAEILDFIADQAVTGVLWLTGDLHFGAIASVDRPGSGGPAEHAWEVLAGPSGSDINPVAPLYTDDTGQFPVLVTSWNYARLVCDPRRGTIQVDFVGDDGSVLATRTLSL